MIYLATRNPLLLRRCTSPDHGGGCCCVEIVLRENEGGRVLLCNALLPRSYAGLSPPCSPSHAGGAGEGRWRLPEPAIFARCSYKHLLHKRDHDVGDLAIVMDNRCVNRIVTGVAVGGALGGSVGGFTC